MAWGRKKKPQEPVLTLEEQEAREERKRVKRLAAAKAADMKIAWIRGTSSEEFQRIFADFDKQVRDTGPASDKDHSLYPGAVLASIRIVKELWFTIDRKIISDDDALILYKIIESSIPLSLSVFVGNRLEQNSVTSSWSSQENHVVTTTDKDGEKTYYSPQKFFRQSVFAELSAVQRRQITGVLMAIESSDPLPKTVTRFPTFNTGIEKLDEAIVSLQGMWEAAVKKKGTVEDEYFLEQMRDSYLPDAWKLFEGFRYASEEMKEKATQILMEQIELLGNQLTDILGKQAVLSLEALKSQTEFLKSRVDSPSGALSLSMEKQESA